MSWVIVLIKNCLLKLSDSEIDKLDISDAEENFLISNGLLLLKLFEIQLFLATDIIIFTGICRNVISNWII